VTLANISSDALQWIQLCQTESLVWTHDDALGVLASVTRVLVRWPRVRTQVDRVCVTSALLRVSWKAHTLLPTLGSAAHVCGARMSRRARVRMAVDHMLRLRCQPALTLASVASDVGVSDAYLSRAFVAETGHHFWESFNAVRIVDAVILVRATQMPIKQIAHAVGYATTSEMDRRFHRCCNIAPSAFRLARPSTSIDIRTYDAAVRGYLNGRPEASPAEVADALGIDFGLALMAMPSFVSSALSVFGQGPSPNAGPLAP
jgi:AraC-like DNA-binding protein